MKLFNLRPITRVGLFLVTGLLASVGSLSAREVCNDGIDNNGDSVIDYEDPDCFRDGRIFFFSTSGNDSWNGRFPTYMGGVMGPKRSISVLNNMLKNESEAGDTFLLRRGDVWNTGSGIIVREGGGTMAKPVLISSYGSGPLPKVSLDHQSVSRLLGVTGEAKHYVIENIHLEARGQPRNDRPSGIFIGNFAGGDHPSYITFNQIKVTDTSDGVISYGNQINFKKSVFKDNYQEGTGLGTRSQGMYISGSGGIIEQNLFDNNGSPLNLGADGNVYSWQLYQSGSNYIIRGNTFQNSFTGVKMRSVDNIVFENNLLQFIEHVTVTLGGDSAAGMRNVMVRKNILRHTGDGIVVKNQSGGGHEVSQVYILNNLIHNNLISPLTGNSSGVYPGMISLLSSANQSLRNVYVFGNTVANLRRKSGLHANENLLTNVQVKNNIFHRIEPHSSQGIVRAFGASDHQYNLYWDGGAPVPDLDATELNADPQFHNAFLGNFLPRPGSPAIDAGTPLGGFYSDDISSFPRSYHFDIGVFESR